MRKKKREKVIKSKGWGSEGQGRSKGGKGVPRAHAGWSLHKILRKFGFHIPDMLSTLPSGRPPAVVQSPIFFKRDNSTSSGMWHVLTLSWMTIGLLRRHSDRPVIGGDIVDAHIPHGWEGSILMCSQLTLGSTQPGEKPVTVHSGDALGHFIFR